MENNQPQLYILGNKKKLFIVLMSWIFFVFQIIIILSYTLADMEYYKKNYLYSADLILFILECIICDLLAINLFKNDFSYYQYLTIVVFVFEVVDILSIIHIILNFSNKPKDYIFLIIKGIELLPGIFYFIYMNSFKGNPAQNNNNNNNNDIFANLLGL